MLKEEFKTNRMFQPVNGRMLIKVVTKDFPTMNLVAGSKPTVATDVRMYIAGTSIKGYMLNQEVLVEPREIINTENKIFDDTNEHSYFKVQKTLKSLKSSEYTKFLKNNPRVELNEYVIVFVNSIIAIVNRDSNNNVEVSHNDINISNTNNIGITNSDDCKTDATNNINTNIISN